MSYITRNLKQTVTYWARGAPDGFGGNTWASPTTLKARWEERNTVFTSIDGTEQVSNTRVYLNGDVAIKGYLFLGTSTASDPTTLPLAREIRDFRKIPNLRNTEFERRALL